MNKQSHIRSIKIRVALAFALAVLADAIELPLNLLFLTAWLAVPAEFALVALDLITMGLLTWLLGFHWTFIAALGVEVLPGADMIPTWTGCVSYVVWQGKKAERKSGTAEPPKPEIIIEISPK